MPDLPVIVVPGVNEELAATSVMGSQLADSRSEKKYDGVLGIWYGKAPGLDRANDAIRHGVFAGTARHGGVVAIVGDDPAAKSSTLPSSSDATMVDLHMPIIFPGDVQEALDLARHSVALSRASGVWVGYKLVTSVADGTGTVDVHPDRVTPVIPTMEFEGKPFVPHPSGRLLTPYTLDMEREFQQVRSELAKQYGVLNKLNRATVRTADDWIGIAACGQTYYELREALNLLGFKDDEMLRRAGIRLALLSMPVPLDENEVRRFAQGLKEVLVVEEKNPTLEVLVKGALYTWDERPTVVGRRDEQGNPLIPGTGALDADSIVGPLRARLARVLGDDRLAPLPPKAERSRIPLTVNRTPFYCSGCPHNISTRVPEGTLVGGGIGCHAMVALMEPDRVGDIAGLTAMGNEGAQWIGMSPFIDRDHIVQNLGDGTYFHSGSLAIRAACASGVNITYKLLYNGTVAMTGGQDPQGQMSVPDVVQDLLLEGVKRIIVTTEDTSRYDDADFGSHAHTSGSTTNVSVWDRTRLIEAQEVLAKVDGVTVLIHDQECAAEKRRARSRGKMAKPDFRIVINERVCEGCGDCGDKSNCLSVQPVSTPYGRKTRIHQTSCNFDMTCLEGDCPSFALVSVDTSAPEKSAAPKPEPATGPAGLTIGDPADGLPDPVPAVPTDEFIVRLSGIGGTGVITVSQILGTAAMLAGKTVRGLDQTGLSQKAGPVVSDVRISSNGTPTSNKANSAGVDCFLAFDLLVAASDTHRTGAKAGRTIVIGSAAPTPTGAMVSHPTTPYPELDVLTGRLAEVSKPELNRYPNSSALASGLFGDAATANILLLGVAVQAGAIAVECEHIERAIELNGVAVERNITAFRWGRRWYVKPEEVEQAAGYVASPDVESLDDLIDRLADDLDRLPVHGVLGEVPRHRGHGAGRRAGRRPRLGSPAGVRRRRGSQPAQADGVQGRVRGRPLAAASGVTCGLRGGRRHEDEGDVAAASPGAPSDGHEEEDEVRPPVDADVQDAARRQEGPRHRRRSVPLGEGPPRGAGDDPRVHQGRRCTGQAAQRRQPGRGHGDRRAPRPGPRLRAHQACPRRDLPRRARRTPQVVRLTVRVQARRMTWSARSKATARWLTAMTVRPAAARFSHKRSSVSTSTALDRSSRTISSGRCTRARAVASRWRWPPDRRRPRGPISVSSALGIALMSSEIAASCSAVSI